MSQLFSLLFFLILYLLHAISYADANKTAVYHTVGYEKNWRMVTSGDIYMYVCAWTMVDHTVNSGRKEDT